MSSGSKFLQGRPSLSPLRSGHCRLNPLWFGRESQGGAPRGSGWTSYRQLLKLCPHNDIGIVGMHAEKNEEVSSPLWWLIASRFILFFCTDVHPEYRGWELNVCSIARTHRTQGRFEGDYVPRSAHLELLKPAVWGRHCCSQLSPQIDKLRICYFVFVFTSLSIFPSVPLSSLKLHVL